MEKITKKELTERCRKILYSSNVVSKQDEKFLIDNVFSFHYDWDNKKGCGVHHIIVSPEPKYNGKCFWIVRNDGTVTDISFTDPIKGLNNKEYEEKRKWNTVCAACRQAVEKITRKMRNEVDLPFTCPITGEVIYDRREIDIHHFDLKFNELFKEWIKDKDIDELYEMTRKSSKCGETSTYFDNERIKLDFIDFHNRNTHLMAISKKANLSIH